MNAIKYLIIVFSMSLIAGCGPVKNQIKNQYKLISYSKLRLASRYSRNSILVKNPTAMSGYVSNQMLYVDKPYELDAFAKNQWVDSPANMLLPLLTQSLSNSRYFYAVATLPYIGKTDYRLDTTIIKLHQNFLSKPSRVEVVIKAMLANDNNRLIASHTFSSTVVASKDTPYGGVIAANKAVKKITESITKFVVSAVKRS
jgi:cholesterol transport system auxiliary component